MKTICFYLLVICLSFSLFSCGKISLDDKLEISSRAINQAEIVTKATSKLSEVASPSIIQELDRSLEKYQPEVFILNPKKEKIYTENTIEVRLKVKDLPIFRNEQLGLGTHLHLILDNQPYQDIYDTKQPVVLENLTPGTHTLRLLAARPWGESFKNDRAYAQTTFHILTKTNDNNPDDTLPLLTYSNPQGTYSAEPILLDFYLNQEAKKNIGNKNQDYLIKVTVNGESFTLNDWHPVYLEGFKRGNNWVQLEIVDREGNIIKNAFNNTIRLIAYEPKNKDTLAKLITGEISLAEARGIVDKDYQPETVSLPEEEETPTVKSEKSATEEIDSKVKLKAKSKSLVEKIDSQVKSEIEPETKVKPQAKPEKEAINSATKSEAQSKSKVKPKSEIEPETEKIDSQVKAETEVKSSETIEKTTKTKPKVNYTPPSVIEELNPVTEEVVETREPTLDVVPIPEKSESGEKAEATEEKSAKSEMENKS